MTVFLLGIPPVYFSKIPPFFLPFGQLPPVFPPVVSLVFMTTRDAIFVNYSAHARVLLARLVLSVCHDYLYGFEVLGTRSNTLH